MRFDSILCRTASYISMLPAIEAFMDSAFPSIGIFIMFLFVIANTETPEEQVHKERMEYIKNCSFKAQNGIEDYNHCMSKRPDIR